MKLFGGKSGGRSTAPQTKTAPAAKRDTAINPPKTGNNTPVRPTAARKPEKKKHAGRGWLIALGVVLVIVLGVYLYWTISTKAPEVGGGKDDPTAEGEEASITADHKDGVHTLLVVGNDQEGFNTDTMMVMRYDSINKTANAVSLPRDTMVNFDKVKKLNAVFFNEGGIEALMDGVEDICGFRPDHYVIVDTNCFVNVVDAMGGIYFDVPVDMRYNDFSDKDKDGEYEYIFNICLDKGYQLLDGYNALGVFRFRKNNDGTGYGMADLDRLNTQHNLLMAAAEQFMGTRNIWRLYQVASIILANSETDLSYGNLQWYARQFLGMSIDDISISTMPNTGTWVRGVSFVTINVDEWIDIINEKLNPLERDITRNDCKIVYWTVQPTLTNGQYYSEVEDLAVTDGSELHTNFPSAR